MIEAIRQLEENRSFKLCVKSSSLSLICRKNYLKTDFKEIKIIFVQKSCTLHPKILEVVSVYTPEENRNKGEATELFLELTKILDSLQIPAWLEVYPYSSNGLNSEQLISFYSKFGFVLDEPYKTVRPFIMYRGVRHLIQILNPGFIELLQKTTGRGIRNRKKVLCLLS